MWFLFALVRTQTLSAVSGGGDRVKLLDAQKCGVACLNLSVFCSLPVSDRKLAFVIINLHPGMENTPALCLLEVVF